MNDDLVLNNVKLINYVINKMGLWESREYYYEIGMVGLVKAAKCFDSSKGFTFSTYAIWCIKNTILLDIKRKKTSKEKANYNTVSLDAPVKSDGHSDIFLADVLGSDFDIEEELIKQEELETLKKAISTLSIREQLILDLIYGPDQMIQSDVAKVFGTTQSSISRILKGIYKKLRKIIEKGDI